MVRRRPAQRPPAAKLATGAETRGMPIPLASQATQLETKPLKANESPEGPMDHPVAGVAAAETEDHRHR